MSKFGLPVPTAVAMLAIAATTATAQMTLKVDGSTGAMPLVSALAKAYEAKILGLKVV